MPEPLRIIFIDNFDSFTWNLVDDFARRGASVEVWRNTVSAEHALVRAQAGGPSLLVLSPGPGTPAGAGCCVELVRRAAEARVPLFGVCLGHQAMIEAFGGVVGPAGEVVHGKTSKVRHSGGPFFEGVPSPFPVGRYHSLAATTVPDVLVQIAGTDRVVMAVAHRSAPQFGVQ
ncbi:MAG: aminodeoxychorismate/anthranilate synthase component II, partial [Gemmatimonadales bacterium]|nr:aminodeoxychorismate/anthranilate synthase component II [Gemmatimonadales bacterium]